MAVNPITPTTSAEQRLIQKLSDLERRIAQLERQVARLGGGA